MKVRLKDIKNYRKGDDNLIALVYDNNQSRLVGEWIENLNIYEGKEYDIEVKQHREKRSLNANNYAWTLTGKIADVLGMGKDECHLRLLARYGQDAKDENGHTIMVSVKADVPEEELIKRLGYLVAIPTHGWVDGQEFIHYRVLKGSRDYNTKEMSVFIDGIVSECKELGIETMTPDEIERMKQQWGAE